MSKQTIKTINDFKSWRERMGFTKPEAATALRINERSVRNWENGTTLKVPAVVCLACELMEQAKGAENE